MSQPISECLVYKACRDEEAFNILLAKMRSNIKHGAFTTYNCKHEPRCAPPTQQQLEALDAKLVRELRKPARS